MAILVSSSLEDFPKTIVVSDTVAMGAIKVEASNNYSIRLSSIFQGAPWPAIEKGMQISLSHAEAVAAAVLELTSLLSRKGLP